MTNKNYNLSLICKTAENVDYFFCSFLRMSMIMQANVTGLAAHTCDFYELTADLDIK